jgi:UDP-glucose 4-epimerase
MTVLVTGGGGYIGSHVSVRLLAEGEDVLIVDDFSNCRRDVITRIAQVAGRAPGVADADVVDLHALRRAVASVRLTGVVHLAGLKSVEESTRRPLDYYRVNVTGTLNVREVAGVAPFVFSSSATVYGAPTVSPVTEDAPLQPVNPYGFTKLVGERILQDASAAAGGSPLAVLRYFNPVGAHASGFIGEDPRGVPQNLMPRIEQVAVRPGAVLTIHGTDYPTRDGTAIRDYVHVEDLADAHWRALQAIRGSRSPLVVNLGTESGHTVLEIVSAFERATGRKIPLRHGPRRDGDVAAMWASSGRAGDLLGWRPTRSVERMCEDALRWRLYRAGFDDEGQEARDGAAQRIQA